MQQSIPIPQKTYQITKRLKSPEAVEKYFPGFMAFTDSIEQQIPKPVDNKRRKAYSQGRRKDILLSRIRLRLTIVVISFIKPPIRKEENMTMIFTRITILSLQRGC